MIAEQRVARIRSNGVYQIDDTLVTLGNFAPNTACYIDVPIGKYTYRQMGISFVAASNIPGVTTLRDGKEFLNSASFTTYIDTITIEIDGKACWEMTAAELLRWNDYQNIATTDGMLRLAFGAPGQHLEDNVEDAYQLGTSNLRQVRLKIKTKPAFPVGMLPVVTCEYLAVARPLMYFVGTTRYSYSNPAIGKYAISDLPVGKDFSAIWTQGASINRIKLMVDDDIVIDNFNTTLRGIHEAFGKDVAALGPGFLFDSFRDGDGIGLDSVADSLAERKRGADVRLEMDMGAAGVNMVIIVLWCGLFSQQ